MAETGQPKKKPTPEQYILDHPHLPKCFTEWIMEWLDEENSDHATHELEEISKAYRAKEYLHTYRKDTTTWTIKRID